MPLLKGFSLRRQVPTCIKTPVFQYLLLKPVPVSSDDYQWVSEFGLNCVMWGATFGFEHAKTYVANLMKQFPGSELVELDLSEAESPDRT